MAGRAFSPPCRRPLARILVGAFSTGIVHRSGADPQGRCLSRGLSYSMELERVAEEARAVGALRGPRAHAVRRAQRKNDRVRFPQCA